MPNGKDACRGCDAIRTVDKLYFINNREGLCIDCHKDRHPWLFSVRSYINTLAGVDRVYHIVTACVFCQRMLDEREERRVNANMQRV